MDGSGVLEQAFANAREITSGLILLVVLWWLGARWWPDQRKVWTDALKGIQASFESALIKMLESCERQNEATKQSIDELKECLAHNNRLFESYYPSREKDGKHD